MGEDGNMIGDGVNVESESEWMMGCGLLYVAFG